MNLANELERAWKTLEAGEPGEPVIRSLADLGVPGSRMMLAIEDGCRELLFPIAEAIQPSEIQRTRGVQVAIRSQGVGDSMRRYLVLRCIGLDFHGVFRRFAAAVLEQVASSSDPARAALDAIRAWQEMFGRAGPKSEATLLGVYGELHELRLLAKRNPRAVQAWTGPYARPQDFLQANLALELKTSRAFAHEVEIHGLEQLWTKGLEQLVLVAKQVAIDAGGERIRDVVAELHASGVDPVELSGRLEAYDLDAEQVAALETPRFAHRNSRYYRVTAQSPALTPDHLRGPLPPGVSRVRYQIALDAPGLEELTGPPLEAFLTRLTAS